MTEEIYRKKVEKYKATLNLIKQYGFDTTSLSEYIKDSSSQETKHINGLMYIVKASPKIKNLKILEKKIKEYLKYIEIVNKGKMKIEICEKMNRT